MGKREEPDQSEGSEQAYDSVKVCIVEALIGWRIPFNREGYTNDWSHKK